MGNQLEWLYDILNLSLGSEKKKNNPRLWVSFGNYNSLNVLETKDYGLAKQLWLTPPSNQLTIYQFSYFLSSLMLPQDKFSSRI